MRFVLYAGAVLALGCGGAAKSWSSSGAGLTETEVIGEAGWLHHSGGIWKVISSDSLCVEGTNFTLVWQCGSVQPQGSDMHIIGPTTNPLFQVGKCLRLDGSATGAPVAATRICNGLSESGAQIRLITAPSGSNVCGTCKTADLGGE